MDYSNVLSECCNEPPIGETCANNLGFCSNWNEGTLFVNDEEDLKIKK